MRKMQCLFVFSESGLFCLTQLSPVTFIFFWTYFSLFSFFFCHTLFCLEKVWTVARVLIDLNNKNPDPDIKAKAERLEWERSQPQPTLILLSSQSKRGRPHVFSGLIFLFLSSHIHSWIVYYCYEDRLLTVCVIFYPDTLLKVSDPRSSCWNC